jgi:hypothetical protein
MKTKTKSIKPASRRLHFGAFCLTALLTGWLTCPSSHANVYNLKSDPADYGLVKNSPNPPVALNNGWTSTGIGTFPAPTPGGSAVFIFALPPLAPGETILSAQLTFVIASYTGSPSFNIDLWGIGFQTNTAPLREHFDADGSDPGNVKLQNNIITPGTGANTTISSANSAGIIAYLLSFYTNNPAYQGGAVHPQVGGKCQFHRR